MNNTNKNEKIKVIEANKPSKEDVKKILDKLSEFLSKNPIKMINKKTED